MTDKEIIRALRCCADHSCSAKCPAFPAGLDCREEMHKELLALIARLTAENAALREGASLGKVKRSQKQAHEKQIKSLQALADRQSDEIESLRRELEWKDMVIAFAQRKQAEAEAERDALLPYAKEYGCETCKNEKACFVQTRGGVTVSCVKCPVPDTCPCSQCKDCGKWEWRGLPEVPEGEKA